MSLPVDDHAFDIAVMALVIFFVPDPAKGVAEMVRTVLPGGIVASYAWDRVNKGSPSDLVSQELSEIGFEPASPPSPKASEMSALGNLWSSASVSEIECRRFKVERKFRDIGYYSEVASLTPNIQHIVPLLTPTQIGELKGRLKGCLSVDVDRKIRQFAVANAIKGTVV